MRCILRPVLLAAVAWCSTALATVTSGQGLTAFTQVRLIDGRGGAVATAMTVVVRGDTIATIGPSATTRVPQGATIINGRGRTLMPGLADMHVHLLGGWDGEHSDLLGYAGFLDALLYAGVTTVHDLGNVLPYVQQLKRETRSGQLRGPRMYIVGALVDGANPAWPPVSYSLSAAERAPSVVRQMKEGDADIIKAYKGLNETLLTALVRAAAAESLRVIADLGFANGSEMGIRAGISAYAHVGTSPMPDSTIAHMKANGVSTISTLAVDEAFSERRLADLAFLRDPLVANVMPSAFVTALTAYARREPTPGDISRRRRYAADFENAKANVRRLHEAGVPIIAGTDAPYPGVYYGEGLAPRTRVAGRGGIIAARSHPQRDNECRRIRARQFVGRRRDGPSRRPSPRGRSSRRSDRGHTTRRRRDAGRARVASEQTDDCNITLIALSSERCPAID